MTFDHVIRSFLANEGKRFRRPGWGDNWIERTALNIRQFNGHTRATNVAEFEEFVTGSFRLLADDWEEVQGE
jgi:hypothetical protein